MSTFQLFSTKQLYKVDKCQGIQKAKFDWNPANQNIDKQHNPLYTISVSFNTSHMILSSLVHITALEKMKAFSTLTFARIVSLGAALAIASDRTSTTVMSETERQIRFEKNSKQMLDKYLEYTPRVLRKKAKHYVDITIADICGDVVTEDDVYEVVRRTTPKVFQKICFQTLDAFKTK